LTVGKHVKLYTGIKNVPLDIKEVLKDIDLLEKENNYPKKVKWWSSRKTLRYISFIWFTKICIFK